mgnify:CR=1 FL=1
MLQKPKFKNQYENFIGGKWEAPTKGDYFDNVSPVDGKSFTKIPRSTAEDIELAIDEIGEYYEEEKMLFDAVIVSIANKAQEIEKGNVWKFEIDERGAKVKFIEIKRDKYGLLSKKWVLEDILVKQVPLSDAVAIINEELSPAFKCAYRLNLFIAY